MSFELDTPKSDGTNLVAARQCETCGGDRFVVYAMRGEFEELDPCPDCNGNCDTTFRRHDGSTFRSPDPAKVRERLMA